MSTRNQTEDVSKMKRFSLPEDDSSTSVFLWKIWFCVNSGKKENFPTWLTKLLASCVQCCFWLRHYVVLLSCFQVRHLMKGRQSCMLPVWTVLHRHNVAQLHVLKLLQTVSHIQRGENKYANVGWRLPLSVNVTRWKSLQKYIFQKFLQFLLVMKEIWGQKLDSFLYSESSSLNPYIRPTYEKFSK